MALVLLTCSSTTSRAIRVWSRMPRMLSKSTWRRPFQSGYRTLPTSILTTSPWWRRGDGWSLPPTANSSEVRLRTLPIMHQLVWPGSLTPLANWWGVYLSRMGEPQGQGEKIEARLAGRTGTVQPHGRPPKTQCTTVGRGGSPPSSPDRGAPDSDGYSTASETAGHWHRCRGHRGSRERKQLVPMRLDMPIFKSTDPGAEVMYTLWCFNVDAFLEQYDEASMRPHIFTSLWGYLGKWACTLDKGKDISVWDLLMHMERTFGNKRDYDAMIRTLYEVQQRDDETVEEYMLRIHEVVAVICGAYLDCLPDRGRDLKKDCFYHGLCPYLHDALSFAMAELPKREQACPTFDTLYTLAKKLEAGQPARTCQYSTSSEAYRDKHRCYLAPVGQVAALEEKGLALSDQVTGEDSESEVEVVGGLNMCLAQAMIHYQQEEQQCFVCGSPGHFAQGCPHRKALR